MLNKIISRSYTILVEILIGLLIFSPGCGISSKTIPNEITTHTLIVQPADGRTPIINAINSAKNRICLTIYRIDDPEIMASLENAATNGVTIEILYNYWSFTEEKREAVLKTMNTLESYGILTKPASSEFAVTHQKTFVIDDSKAIIMTFNLQSSYFVHTRDFGIITTDPDEVSEIVKVFQSDWNYTKVTPEVASLVWSNDNARTKILELVRSATQSLKIYCEEMEDQQFLDALIMKADSGVSVQVISAQLGGTGEADENKKYREYLNQHGVQAKYMPTDDYLYCHAKMILVDYGTSNAKAFVGSENFSSASLDKNRELGIIVSESDILSTLHNTFETDWLNCRYDF